MRECPNCHVTSTEWRYRAWTVQAQGSVRFSENGTVESLGPAVAVTVVKPGKELGGAGTLLTCLNCNHTANIKKFPTVVPSFFSGNRSDATIYLSILDMHVPIQHGEEEAIGRFITPASIRWDSDDAVLTELTTFARSISETARQ